MRKLTIIGLALCGLVIPASARAITRTAHPANLHIYGQTISRISVYANTSGTTLPNLSRTYAYPVIRRFMGGPDAFCSSDWACSGFRTGRAWNARMVFRAGARAYSCNPSGPACEWVVVIVRFRIPNWQPA